MKNILYISIAILLVSCGGGSHSANDGHDHESGVTHEQEKAATGGDNHEGDDHEGHDHGAEAVEGGGHSDEVFFSHEQSAKIDFSIDQVSQKPLNQVIKTHGQIISPASGQAVVVASADGVVKIAGSQLLEGESVRQGQTLFNIAGDELSDGGARARYQEAKAQYDKARNDYTRAEELVKDLVISRKEFEAYKLAFREAEITFRNMDKGFSAAGRAVSAPIGGYLKSISVKNGEYVQKGQPLAVIAQSKRLILKAEVAQQYLSDLGNIISANFVTPYNSTVYSLDKLAGKLVSIGKSADNNTFYTPVNFEFDNRDNIIEGTFVTVYLKTAPIAGALSIPVSSLLEEMGNYYVYVQVEGEPENFMKHEVKLGVSDGENVQILSGLTPDGKVVTRGAYFVKLASAAGAMPADAHNH